MGRRKDLIKEAEQIDAVGQEDEKKGIKAVQEVMKEQEKKEAEKEDRILNSLHRNRGSIKTYNSLLRDLLSGFCSTVEMPSNYRFEVVVDEKGVALVLDTPFGYFARGFKPTGLEIYDLNAINSIVRDLEDCFDELKTRTDN